MNKTLTCNAEAAKFADGEVAQILKSWNQPHWDELEWSRIKELTTRDLIEYRHGEGVKAQQAHAFDCPDFVKHVSGSIFIEKKLYILIRRSFPCAMTNGS